MAVTAGELDGMRGEDCRRGYPKRPVKGAARPLTVMQPLAAAHRSCSHLVVFAIGLLAKKNRLLEFFLQLLYTFIIINIAVLQNLASSE